MTTSDADQTRVNDTDTAATDDTSAPRADAGDVDTPGEGSTAIDLGDATLSVPADADSEEAAAIATAIGAHLANRARTAARTASDSPPEPADRWRLAARLRGRRLPREISQGEEWAAAARSRW